ncbi:recombinase family protein [Anaeromicropila populeti]|uniref:Site-specific DNA recombinase n=1 Tax=Anaeromicropila populeti TaxID=37658 RepID=A0A1I6JB71_9FIRM|nr:recombinase family protein [Anaeromicropila populeti]SFR76186.1 Site-specific DNA recombinase [Anaeromicropila populeti]
MARKSRIKSESVINNEVDQRYKTALYARLSNESNGITDGESMETQVHLLQQFVKEHPDLKYIDTYIDNGFSGTNFHRPEFERLMEDIKRGKIQCIVVKDLSRFARNYIEAGEYIEKILPQYQVRLIAVTDQFDSQKKKQDELVVALKNLINDVYAKDISKKTGSVFRMKQHKGEFIGSYAPYGYQKSEKNKNRLIVDKETAPIVKKIFEWKIAGLSDMQIARNLNMLEIMSPLRYKYEIGMVKNEKYYKMLWKPITISQILKNQIYLGHMVQGKSCKSLYQGKSYRSMSEIEWIIVKNTHEAIIAEDIFGHVSRILNERKQKYFNRIHTQSSVKKEEHLLVGYVYCGDCQHHLTLMRSGDKKFSYWYRCPNYQNNRERGCIMKSIRKEVLEQIVFQIIQIHIRLFLKKEVQQVQVEGCLKNRMDLSRKMVVGCINRIELFEKKRVEIQVSFQDEFLTLNKRTEMGDNGE